MMLRRMEGFKDPWESAVFKGRLLAPDRALQDSGIASGDMIITVRRVLVPEGVPGVEPRLFPKSFYDPAKYPASALVSTDRVWCMSGALSCADYAS